MGYILNHKGEIESINYKDYLREFGSDETTTPNGVAPRLYVEGNSIMTWGCTGNRKSLYSTFKNKREATAKLYEIWENYIEESNWDAPRFFKTKKDLIEDLADLHQKDVKVIKRYFRFQDFLAEKTKQSKIKHDNRPKTTVEMMLLYIENNRKEVQSSLQELDALKKAENKEIWQVKANSLIQKVCNNDFRTLNWKEVYNLIRKN